MIPRRQNEDEDEDVWQQMWLNEKVENSLYSYSMRAFQFISQRDLQVHRK